MICGLMQIEHHLPKQLLKPTSHQFNLFGTFVWFIEKILPFTQLPVSKINIFHSTSTLFHFTVKYN